MTDKNNVTEVFLKDYTPPAFWVNAVTLDVSVHADHTLVSAKLEVERNPNSANGNLPLVLWGEELETLSVAINGEVLSSDRFRLSEHELVIDMAPAQCVVETLVRIYPDKNTQLSGFYKSQDGFFTQCEPQGFRRITWFADRPDVMAKYRVTLHADKKVFPVLLANGNPVASGDEAGGRHYATWEDPFKKPSYLFAMVAAKLDVLKDFYTTASGRQVQLAIYVEPGKLDQCSHAMAALKKAMQWDEVRFGLECDLDYYMIVAVGDFNMGAMENKGLNIFNTKYVLARPDVATDVDFENIDRVVAHEYFHNWTGNRVTCRDWFQLSLKEGLTVYRDQEFGADTHGRETARIREVRGLRAVQFPEDAGPMAHPVRPSSYVEINNFYTATVYEKGAEVVRMIETLIGRASFRKGMDLYFERHDGQAVTCDDFVAAMATVSGFDFSQFMNWYRQSGTPRVSARGVYDADTQSFALHLTQNCPATPGQAKKEPYLIPVSVGFIDAQGKDVVLSGDVTTQTLLFNQPEQTFEFENIPAGAVPSLLRDFSAPIVFDYPYTDDDLTHLLAYDSDPFNRWEAGQRLFGALILQNAQRLHKGQETLWPQSIINATRKVLLSNADPAFIAEALTLPTEATLAEQMDEVDPDALYAARSGLLLALASGLEGDFVRLYAHLTNPHAYASDNVSVGRRRLRNLCLAYMNEFSKPSVRAKAMAQFETADNMTDQFAALSTLANVSGSEGGAALESFYTQWQHEALVVDKWLVVQASSRLDGTLERVKALTNHAAFDIKNPNKVYALLRTFGTNHRHFHAKDGSGYAFMAEQIIRLNAINPQVAARLARCFDRWKKFDASRQNLAKAALSRVAQQENLSRDVREVVDRALAAV